MRISTENSMSFEKHEEREKTAMPDSSVFRKNAIGAVVLLLISLALITFLLLPNVMNTINDAIRSHGMSEWLFVTASGFVIGFLIGFPLVLLVQSIVDYRRARDLERLGLMTKGLLVEKWVETLEDGKPVYRVRYKYLTYLKAVQTVDEETYKQIRENETLFILYLKHLPHISRLDLD